MKAAAALLLGAALSAAASAQPPNLDEVHVGSFAQLWLQRTPQEKAGFLEGLCEGFAAYPSKLGQSHCAASPGASKDKKGWTQRFCGLVNGLEPRKAVEYMDAFFKQKQYTEIQNWAAITAYNDKACGEHEITPSLARMQKKNECNRAMFNMPMSVSNEARQKQKEYCDSLPAR